MSLVFECPVLFTDSWASLSIAGFARFVNPIKTRGGGRGELPGRQCVPLFVLARPTALLLPEKFSKLVGIRQIIMGRWLISGKISMNIGLQFRSGDR